LAWRLAHFDLSDSMAVMVLGLVWSADSRNTETPKQREPYPAQANRSGQRAATD